MRELTIKKYARHGIVRRWQTRGENEMSITLKRKISEYVLHPEGGPYSAVLSEIRSHEGVETAYGVKDRLQLTFQTTEKTPDNDRPMTICIFLNATLNEKGRLMGLLAQQVPAMELAELVSDGKEVNIEGLLIGTQWLLTVEHNESNGKTYDNVTNLMKAPPEQHLKPWKEN